MRIYCLLAGFLLSLLTPAMAARLSGNTITADGTYSVPTLTGSRYVFSVSGSFGGGSLAVKWADSAGNLTAYASSPATTATSWSFTASSEELDFVLTGATAPALVVSVAPDTQTGGGAGSYTAGAGLTLTGETFSLTKDSTLSALTIGSGKTISAGSSITTHASNAAITTAQNGGITTGTGGSLTTSTGTVSFGNTGANGIIFYANNVALVTLPNGTSTLARTDSGQTFAGGQVFTGQISSSGSTSTASTDNVVNIATNDARYGQSIKAIAVADLAPIQSQTTLQSTGLSVTLSAGTWHIKAHTVLTNANTAAQAKFGGTIVGGSSAELYGMQLYGVGNSTALGDLQASPLTGGRAFASSLSRAFCDVDFVLVVTSGAPVVTTQYAQNSSTAGDTILKAGSYLIATKL